MSGKEYDSTLSPTVDGTPKEVNFGGDYQELGGDEVKVSFSEPAVGGEEATASDALLRKDIESKMGERRPVEEGFSVGDQTPHPRAPPQENRNSGMGRALANIIKANLGSGLLSLPFAFTQAGVAVGTVLILIVALLAIHCMTLLAKCKKHMPEHSATYGEIAKYAMGKAGTYLVNVFVTISQLGFCCAYLIFIANNISALIHNGDVCDDRWMFILGLLVVMIPLVLLRTLKFLGVLSIIGNVCIFSGVGIVSVYTIMHYAPVDVEIAVWDTFPSFFGTAVFTYEGIALVSLYSRPHLASSSCFSLLFSSTIFYLSPPLVSLLSSFHLFSLLATCLTPVTNILCLPVLACLPPHHTHPPTHTSVSMRVCIPDTSLSRFG
mmetsp:Transcript_16242/g.41148  ORF Transcript_16242/g.41148 Transcript_16242/m.41148 type:complete len:379 (-) Transcript_16242:106-1242(-)